MSDAGIRGVSHPVSSPTEEARDAAGGSPLIPEPVVRHGPDPRAGGLLREGGRRRQPHGRPAPVQARAPAQARAAAIVTGAAGAGAGQAGGSIGTGAGGDGVLASCPTTAITPTPLRRLTKFEYANTVRNLLGVDTTPRQRSARRRGHGRLQQQRGRADGVVAARGEVRAGVGGAGEVGGEEPVDADGRCNTTTKTRGRLRAGFREHLRAARVPAAGRPTEDRQILMAAYSAGRTGGSYAEGIEVMIRAALQSAHFLYRLETTAPASATAQLVPLCAVRAGVAAVVPDLGGGPGRRAAGRRRARRAGRQDGRGDEGARDARRSEGAGGDHRLLQPVDRDQPPRHHEQGRRAVPGVLRRRARRDEGGDARVRASTCCGRATTS